jgi:hypothetical protein
VVRIIWYGYDYEVSPLVPGDIVVTVYWDLAEMESNLRGFASLAAYTSYLSSKARNFVKILARFLPPNCEARLSFVLRPFIELMPVMGETLFDGVGIRDYFGQAPLTLNKRTLNRNSLTGPGENRILVDGGVTFVTS